MRKAIVALLIAELGLLGCGRGSSSTATPSGENPRGLLLSYSFEEDAGSRATNSARDRWHGELNGVSRISASVPNGRAIHFGTAGSFVKIDTNEFNVKPDLLKFSETQQITIEAYVRVAAVPQGKVYGIAGASQAPALLLRDGKPEFTTATWDHSRAVVVTSDTVLATNQWYHLVATYNGSDAAIYIDGKVDKTANISYTLGDMFSPRVGGLSLEDADFVGDMDEVRIHNAALTAQQVLDRYNSLKH